MLSPVHAQRNTPQNTHPDLSHLAEHEKNMEIFYLALTLLNALKKSARIK